MKKSLIAFVVTTLLAVPMVFAQSDDTPLAHAKMFQLLKHSWLLESVSVNALSHESDKTKLSWIDEAFGQSTMIYSLDDGLFGEKIAVFPAADKESNAEYFVVAFLETRKLLGIRADVHAHKLVFFDFKINKSIEADPFIDASIKLYSGDLGKRQLVASYPDDLDRFPITHELIGETLQKATCIWNTVKTSLAVSGFRDLARFVCNFNTLTNDAKQMVGLAKSIGGCVTGGVVDCILATTETGFLIADPACRPAWMNVCFGDSGVAILWVTSPPNSLQAGQTFDVEWRVTGGRSIEHTNIHYGTNLNTVNSGNADYGTTIQSGSPETYRGTITLPSQSFASGTQFHFVAHARVDGREYYSSIVSSSTRRDPVIINWVNSPPSTLKNGQRFDVEWRISGGRSVSHTNIHFGTNRNTVTTGGADYGTTAQSGSSGTYRATVSLPSQSFPGGTQFYFVIHARVDGEEYYGDIATATIAGDAAANLEITFDPNPVSASSISSCDHNYSFSLIVRETGGVGVTLTEFQYDGRTLELSRIGLPTQIRANDRIVRGITWCRGTGSSTWTILGRDDNGRTGSWRGTVQFR